MNTGRRNTVSLVARTQKQLENVQRAIEVIETGAQSYFIEENGMRRELKRGDLETLYKRENSLIARLQKLSGRSHSKIYPSP